MYGLYGLLLLILDVVAIYRVMTTRIDPGMKLVWVLVILLLIIFLALR